MVTRDEAIRPGSNRLSSEVDPVAALQARSTPAAREYQRTAIKSHLWDHMRLRPMEVKAVGGVAAAERHRKEEEWPGTAKSQGSDRRE